MLSMCIRALDYCPPVDITFGEYLRALITADFDLVPKTRSATASPSWKRSAARGILPRDVRTISAETLVWNTPRTRSPAWLNNVFDGFDFGWDRLTTLGDLSRSTRRTAGRCGGLKSEFASDPELCTRNSGC